MDVEISTRISTIEQAQWNALLPDDNPFVRHEFLAALEECNCIGPEIGWQPQHTLLRENGRLLAASPGYIKHNSHGEFVFDFAWADAHMRHGLRYYPKFLCASPYSPITGSRLLASQAEHRGRLVQAQLARIQSQGWLSGHWNFLNSKDCAALDDAQLLRRRDWQFHWFNLGYASFDDFLGDLSSKKRKNIRQERRRVADAGFRFQQLHGDELDETQLEQITTLYRQTFLEKGNRPVLNQAFFTRIARDFGRRMLAIIAWHGGEMLAMSLFFRSADRLYGRYWGSHVEASGLHFETCYYQGIEYAIDQGLSVFEPGAQGEHKIARGFFPVPTHSRHYIRIEPFRDAIGQWLGAEARALDDYQQELMAHLPFRQDVCQELMQQCR